MAGPPNRTSSPTVRALYAVLLNRSKTDPSAYSNAHATLVSLSRRLEFERKPAMAALVRSLGPL
jgi:hypothetical protein